MNQRFPSPSAWLPRRYLYGKGAAFATVPRPSSVARASSWPRLDPLDNRPPQLLLAADERLGLGRGEVARVGAELLEALLQLRLRHHRAQVAVEFLDNRCGHAGRRHHRS